MNKPSDEATIQEARQAIDAMLEEEANALNELGLKLAEAALENHNLDVARCFIVEDENGRFHLTPAGEVLLEMDRLDLLWKAGELILADIRRQCQERRELEQTQTSQQDKTKVN